MTTAHAKTNYILDEVGNSYMKINIKDFEKWYNQNKEIIDKTPTKTFNTRFKIVDDNNRRYKLERRKGNTIITRMNPDSCLSKHDILNRLGEFEAKIHELETLLESVKVDDTEEKDIVIDLNKKTNKFDI